jgi:DNA-binding response OmpR family regulator
MRILVVDDELAMREVLVDTLQAEGYRVAGVGDGEEALEMVFAREFDLVLLDVMMPRLDGFAVCAEMRKRGLTVPVLMLTARGMVEDRVRGLDCGGDDYLVKPFSLKELLARIRALTRRQERREVPGELELAGVVIDFKARTCRREGKVRELNAKEGGILELLVMAEGATVSRDRFLDEVWGYHAHPGDRTVDNFIVALRKKLGPAGRLIKTVRGEGYRLEEPP